jgi:rRNA maturation endonuclease Nob1
MCGLMLNVCRACGKESPVYKHICKICGKSKEQCMPCRIKSKKETAYVCFDCHKEVWK